MALDLSSKEVCSVSMWPLLAALAAVGGCRDNNKQFFCRTLKVHLKVILRHDLRLELLLFVGAGNVGLQE